MLTKYRNKGTFYNTNKNGFTVIELLAVIVILAIIAFIVVPNVLNIINDAKKSAAKVSTYGYVAAIEKESVLYAIKDKKYEDKEDYSYDEIKVNLKGTMPTGGIYSLKNGVVTNGSFCINGYVTSYQNNKVEVVDKRCTEESIKLDGRIKLSKMSGNYTYPASQTIEVIENKSGGAITCETSDSEIATCSVSGNTIIVAPGTSEGNATITVTSASTKSYKEAKAAYLVVTTKGTLVSYTANGYDGLYDGNSHSITVTSSDSIIEYKEEGGTYGNKKPTYSDVGEYTVYYKIEQAGYNTITGNKKVVIKQAEGDIELETNTGTIEYNKEQEIEITKNISKGKIEIVNENPDIVEARIENEKLVIKGKNIGSTTLTLTSASTRNYKSASTEYEVEVIKADNTLKLETNTGNYTYPNDGTVEVIENVSGGVLDCIPDDSNIATCSVSGNTITIKPGKTEGSTTLTITSAPTPNYNEGQAAYVVVTAKGTLTSYTAIGYDGKYDGDSHSITVTSSDSVIEYKEEGGTYSSRKPTYSDVGTYTVYYKIEQAGYNTVTGSKQVVITKAEGNITKPTAKTLTYTGDSQTLINAGSTSTGTIQYKLESSGTYSTNLPTAKNAGEYTVYYKVVGDKNHEDVAESSINVTINKANLSYTSGGYNDVYDGNSHGITVTSDGNIKYGTSNGTYDKNESPAYSNVGTYTVYYEITKEGYNTVTGSESVVITKANNELELSANTGTYTYPTKGTFTVTKNISRGTLECISDNDNIATCSIEGNTVTVSPGTTEGNTTLTITSKSTPNYNEAKAAYEVITQPGTLSVTANGYNGPEDGNNHGITVTSSGATIKYAEGIGLNESDITQKDYTVIDGGTYTLNNETSGNVLNNFAIQIWNTNGTYLEDISFLRSEGKNKTVYVHGYDTGLYIVRVKANGSTQDSAVMYNNIYFEKGKNYNISYEVTKLTESQVIAKDIAIHKDYTLNSSPTYKNVGTYPVYYQVSKAGYTTVTGRKDVVIREEEVVAPTRSTTTSNSASITAVYNTGSATSGIASTSCYRTDSSGKVLGNGTLSGKNCVFSGLSSNTTYYYKKCITTEAGNTSCSDVSNILTAGAIESFDYTKEVQRYQYQTTCTGKYKLEVWGASGGYAYDAGRSTGDGGYGAYAVGNVSLNSSKYLFITVGGEGQSNCQTTNCKGGYNGGSDSTLWANGDGTGLWTGGGGGATHIASKEGLLRDFINDKEKIYIVSAGGGGGDYYPDWGLTSTGGSGGGIAGNNGVAGQAANPLTGYNGTQNSGYSFGTAGTTYTTDSCGGSGGGWYGGISGLQHSTGSGGSSYIGNTSLTDKSMYCYNCAESNEESTKTISTTNVSKEPISERAKIGNGYAKITILSCSN